MDQKMEQIYYKSSNPAAFGGVKRLQAETNKSAKEWLKSQRTYTLHKPVKRVFPTRSYRAKYPHQFWQADLNEMQEYSRINSGNRYILTVIDVFSRFAMALPLKDKTGSTVKTAFQQLFKENGSPKFLHTDQGKEFENSQVQSLLQLHDCKHFTVKSPFKAAMVERFNRTLKEKMFRYFTRVGNRKWIQILPDLLTSYNNAKHKTIGMTPIDALKKVNIVYSNQEKRLSNKNNVKQIFKIGDYVRLAKVKKTFEKGFTPNWTEEVFTIKNVNKRFKPLMYVVQDYYGKEIDGKFYTEELQKISKPEYFAIEKVMRRKGDKYLVKYIGYPEPEWTSSINKIDAM